jgi:hypothetical protein
MRLKQAHKLRCCRLLVFFLCCSKEGLFAFFFCRSEKGDDNFACGPTSSFVTVAFCFGFVVAKKAFCFCFAATKKVVVAFFLLK